MLREFAQWPTMKESHITEKGFKLYFYEYTEEEFQAIARIRQKYLELENGEMPSASDVLEVIHYDSSVVINIYHEKVMQLIADAPGVKKTFLTSPTSVFTFYNDGNLTCTDVKGGRQVNDGRPANLADLFGAKYDAQRIMMKGIMITLESESFLWKDLAADMEKKCAYAAIPTSEVMECSTKAELMEKHYGITMKRFNRESLGKCIFLCKASKLVEPNELQKLYAYEPSQTRFDKWGKGMYHELANYIGTTCPECYTKPIKLGRGRTAYVDEDMIVDAIRMAHSFRLKIPLTFHSANAVYEWHDEIAKRDRGRGLPKVEFPRDSIYKKLKLPDECVRLKTKKMFVDEGNYQHNCVTGYIELVNDDCCSIWSMRKPDGTRYTIEIRTRTSKYNPNGYFYINQMFGFGNSEAPPEEIERVRNAIQRQMPYVKKGYV